MSRRWAPRSGSACSPSSTWSIRTSSGGSSSFTAKRRACCEPRSARRSTLLLFAFARLIGYAPHEAPKPTDADMDAAAAVIARQTATFPYLVFLRDKAVLFDEDKSGFVMYGVQGRTWVALGDPVGPPERMGALIRLFLERCDDFGGVPVFYEISQRASASLCRRGPDVRQAWRGGASRSDGVHARRRPREEISPGDSIVSSESRRRFESFRSSRLRV